MTNALTAFLTVVLILLSTPANTQTPSIDVPLGGSAPNIPIDIDNILESDPINVCELLNCQSVNTSHNLAGSETPGIIVRQYDVDPFVSLEHPGFGVTGVHTLVKSAVEDPFSDTPVLASDVIDNFAAYGVLLQKYRDTPVQEELEHAESEELNELPQTEEPQMLRVYPGFRLGVHAGGVERFEKHRCSEQGHWDAMVAALNLLLALTKPDEMIVFDGEYYTDGIGVTTDGQKVTKGEECVIGTYDASVVNEKMTEFNALLRSSGRRVGYYPANPDDIIMRNVMANGADGSEMWLESSFGQTLHYATSPSAFMRSQHITQHLKEQLERRFPNAHFRQGLFDDALRQWGDVYRLSESFPARSWVFDANRSDPEHWGSVQWREGECFVDMLDEKLHQPTHVWPMWQGDSTAQVFGRGVEIDGAGNRSSRPYRWRNYIPDLMSSLSSDQVPSADLGVENALWKFHTANSQFGFTEGAIVPRQAGYAPGQENYLQINSGSGPVADYSGPQTFKISFILDADDINSNPGIDGMCVFPDEPTDPEICHNDSTAVALLSLWSGTTYTENGSFISNEYDKKTFNLAVRGGKLEIQLSTQMTDSPAKCKFCPQTIVIDDNPPAGKLLSVVIGYEDATLRYGYMVSGDVEAGGEDESNTMPSGSHIEYQSLELGAGHNIRTSDSTLLEVGRIQVRRQGEASKAHFMGNTVFTGQVINWNRMLSESAIMGTDYSVGALRNDYPFGNYRAKDKFISDANNAPNDFCE